jgi:hypothetical protein
MLKLQKMPLQFKCGEANIARNPIGPGRRAGRRAVANGVRLGRKPTLTHHQQQEAIKRVKASKETLGFYTR